MPISHKGLVKLMEECGEVIQVAAKLVECETNPNSDTKEALVLRLEEEIADANAAMLFVVNDTMKLSMNRIHVRCVEKRKKYNEWNAEALKTTITPATPSEKERVSEWEVKAANLAAENMILSDNLMATKRELDVANGAVEQCLDDMRAWQKSSVVLVEKNSQINEKLKTMEQQEVHFAGRLMDAAGNLVHVSKAAPTPQTVAEPKTARLYYEAHVTIEPVFDKRLEFACAIAKQNNFKMADLLMKKREQETESRSKNDTFMTGHGKDYADIKSNLINLILTLQLYGFKVWRYKIEDTLLDSRHDGDALMLLANGATAK